jgi:hypothetical protein
MKIMVKILALLLAVMGCSRSMPAMLSPNGTLTLVTFLSQKHDDPEYGCLVFEIHDASGKVLCRENTGAKASGWGIGWSSDDQVFAYCSDIGTQHWNKQADGSWKKQ